MWTRKKKWLVGIGVALGAFALAVGSLLIWASTHLKRVEPEIRKQAIAYLSRRFRSEVEIGTLNINMPRFEAFTLWRTGGRGLLVEVIGNDTTMRHLGRRDIPPLFTMKEFRFRVDLGNLFDPEKKVSLVHLKGLVMHIPPKGDRPNMSGGDVPASDPLPIKAADVLLENVLIEDSRLVILPKRADRKALEFELHNIELTSVKMTASMDYKATLTNPRPPGKIESKGKFGPWDADSPSDTPLEGDYRFSNADLGVFSAIAGTLQSTGTFRGSLGAVDAKGVCTVPDFRLKAAGRPMNLRAEFAALVDGSNGNTELRPVRAQLASTRFTTSGAVVKHDGDAKRTIELDVQMPDGEMKDLLMLATKSDPLMQGRIKMNAKIKIPPFSSRVKEKLLLDGKFEIAQGQFLMEAVQDKVDTLSRRGQGQPKNEAIDDVFSQMAGEFHLDNQVIDFTSLSFQAPGARVDLTGNLDLSEAKLDFAGSLKLDAKVSQTMTGWKRWMLKPIDPLFAKQGAGTFLKIKIQGTSKEPKFSASR